MLLQNECEDGELEREWQRAPCVTSPPSLASLLARTDKALYAAKTGDRKRIAG